MSSSITPGRQGTKLCNLRAWPHVLKIGTGLLGSIYGLYSLHCCTALLWLPSYPCNCFLVYLITKNNCVAQNRICVNLGFIVKWCLTSAQFTVSAHPLQHIHRRRHRGWFERSDLSKKISLCFLLSSSARKLLLCVLCLLYIYLLHGTSTGLDCSCSRIRPLWTHLFPAGRWTCTSWMHLNQGSWVHSS